MDKNLLKKNILFLREKNPAIIDKLLNKIEEIESNLKIEKNKDDLNVFFKEQKIENLKELSRKKLSKIYDITGRVYITDDENVVEKLNIFDKDLIKDRKKFIKNTDSLIILGAIPFFHIKDIVEKNIFPNLKAIVIYENNIEFVYLLLSVIDIQKIANDYKINFFLSFDLEFYEKILSYIINYYTFTSYIKSYEDKNINIAEEILNRTHTLNIRGFSIQFQKDRIINTKENIIKLKHKRFLIEESTSSSLKDIPVFIVGSGPSLDKSIDILKKLENRAIFVSLTSTIYPLYQNKFKPDFVSVIDPSRRNIPKFLKNISKNYLKDIYTFAGIYTPLEFNKQFRETLFFNYGFFKEFLNIGNKIRVPEYGGTTVLNPTFSLLIALGFRKIYLVGIDLGGKKRDRTHAKFYNEILRDDDREFFIELEGNFGGKILSRFDYYSSKIMLEKQIEEASKIYSDLEVFNISDGAKIKGTIPLHGEYAVEKLKTEINKSEVKSSILNLFSNEKVKLKNDVSKYVKKELIPFFESLIKALNKSKSLDDLFNILNISKQKILEDKIALNLISITSTFSMLITLHRLTKISLLEETKVNENKLKVYIEKLQKEFIKLLKVI